MKTISASATCAARPPRDLVTDREHDPKTTPIAYDVGSDRPLPPDVVKATGAALGDLLYNYLMRSNARP